MALSKRLRYEILRRDNHACRYCGATAPAAALTVDHVTPVALGGSDDPGNLVAACKDCNAGKSASAPDSALVADVSAESLRWAAAIRSAASAQLLDYDLRGQRRQQFLAAWNAWTYPDASAPGRRRSFDLPADWMASVDNILACGLPVVILCECVDLAMGQRRVQDEFRYMCGIAWRKVDAMREIAADLLAADDVEGGS